MKKFVLILALISTAHAQEDFSKEIEKATPIGPSLYMIEGAGGNVTAFIGKSGTLLVDDDFAPMAEKLLNKLKELGGSSPRYIINTHFHYDHTGGNEAFGSTATIIAATETRERLMHEQTLWHKQHAPVSEKALPTVTFDQSLTIHLNHDDVTVLHMLNGHTDGDSVVLFNRGKVVCMGDLYFSGMFPIFHPEHNGSLDGLVRNLETLLKKIPTDAKIVPGHGPISNRAALEKYYRMIVDSISTVRNGIGKGQTLEQIQKTGLDKEWEPFSHGFRNTDQWIESIYRSLKK